MKKKLILGLGIVACIFIIAGYFIIRSLSQVYFGDKLKDEQGQMLYSYDRVLYLIKDTQKDLYAFEAGHGNQESLLDDDLARARKRLSLIWEGYAHYSSLAACSYCHSLENTGGTKAALGRIRHHEEKLKEIHDRTVVYEEKLHRVVASGNGHPDHSLVKEASREGEEIIALIDSVRSPMVKMNERMEESQISLIDRSKYSILIALFVSIILSAAAIFVLIRSITKPVAILVRGIKRVSSGDYDSKVRIESKDEIGFISAAFNEMTDNLNIVTRQREMLVEELRELNGSLERRINEATEELKTAHKAILRSETLSTVGTFAAGVAHELATPLSSALGYFQLVKSSIPEQDRLAKDIQLIEKELLRCRTILRGMLDIARKPEEEMVLTDVNRILRDVLALVRYQPERKKSLIIREDLDPDIPCIMAVPGQIRQVLLNIIVNALQAMPEGGELGISTSLAGERVAVRISDNGRGIPEDELNMIFQPFYTGKKAGTGLGLSISHGIIKFHGGEIKAESECGKGTTFSVYLPASAKTPCRDEAGAAEGI